MYIFIAVAYLTGSEDKPGICPAPLESDNDMQSDACVSLCRTDSDCAGQHKCCASNCGLACVIPLPDGKGDLLS